MNEKSSSPVAQAPRGYPKGLLNIALVLAAVTAVFHLYIGVAVFGLPSGIVLVLIALVYLGGIGLIAANNRRSLWLKVGVYWVIIVIVVWAVTAALNSPNTNVPIAYADKAVEFILLGVLLRIRTSGTVSTGTK